MPGATRTLLRIAAVDDGEVLAEIMSAAEIVDGVRRRSRRSLPAVEAQLIDVDGTSVRFRHPLVRSAIHQSASVAERHTAHAALAAVLADKPDRRVWHRAAATIWDDPGGRVRARASSRRAQAWAGALAVAPSARGGLHARGRAARSSAASRAALARELGRNETVMRLLREADSLELGSRDRARSMSAGESFQRGAAETRAGACAG